jgi:hypothetical protein
VIARIGRRDRESSAVLWFDIQVSLKNWVEIPFIKNPTRYLVGFCEYDYFSGVVFFGVVFFVHDFAVSVFAIGFLVSVFDAGEGCSGVVFFSLIFLGLGTDDFFGFFFCDRISCLARSRTAISSSSSYCSSG